MNSSSGAPASLLSTQPLCALFVALIPGTVSAVGCLVPCPSARGRKSREDRVLPFLFSTVS